MKRLFLMIGLLLSFLQLYSWDLSGIVGGRSNSMGNCSVALSDFWSIANNPAGIAGAQHVMAGTHDPGGTSTSLSSSDYAGSFFRDTDFGGKTGTSNSHADAWFMAVSPKLCVGAWVGGEYRSIHFKSGRLGQGSRSALPICGYFIKSVFSDPAYKKYHGHFAKPDDESITSSMYNCVTYIAPVKHDTVRHDSAHYVSNEEVILDEDGNPVEEPQNQAQSSTSSSSATTSSKTTTKTF